MQTPPSPDLSSVLGWALSFVLLVGSAVVILWARRKTEYIADLEKSERRAKEKLSEMEGILGRKTEDLERVTSELRVVSGVKVEEMMRLWSRFVGVEELVAERDALRERNRALVKEKLEREEK